MNIDLKSAAIGLALGLVVWGGWYAGSTRPVIEKLVEEKAQAVSRANQLEQESAKYKAAAEHWFEVANSQPQPQVQSQSVPQDPAVATLNAVRPGLGTLASAVTQAWQQHQTQQQAQQVAKAQDQACAPLTWTGSGCGCSEGYTATKTGCLDSKFVNKFWTADGSKYGCAENQIFLSGTGCLTCAAALHPGTNDRGNWGCVR